MRLAIRLARDSIHSHQLRYRLSTIGVVVSVFLVSIVFIINASLQSSINQQRQQIHRQTIIINGSVNSKLLNITLTTPSNSLASSDLKRIQKDLKPSSQISNLFLIGNIGFNGSITPDITTVASSANHSDSLNLTVDHGSWFNDEKDNKQWVVLGEELANQLLGTNIPRNQVVDIKGQKFTVVGVLKRVRQTLSLYGYNPDKAAFISLANGQKISHGDSLSQIIINNKDTLDTKTAQQQLSRILSTAHPDNSDYNIETGSSLASKLIELINYLTIMACGIAGVILIVSIVSIANITLVGVVERRREIGIRKAVGATTRNIMGQFMAEAVIMAVRGGGLGLVIAYLTAALLLMFLSIPIVFSWLALVLGFIVPIMVGIFAGIYPAYRASRQDIIEALNQLT